MPRIFFDLETSSKEPTSVWIDARALWLKSGRLIAVWRVVVNISDNAMPLMIHDDVSLKQALRVANAVCRQKKLPFEGVYIIDQGLEQDFLIRQGRKEGFSDFSVCFPNALSGQV